MIAPKAPKFRDVLAKRIVFISNTKRIVFISNTKRIVGAHIQVRVLTLFK